MTYAEFERKWLGGKVNYDGVYGYQCVDLIKQYMKECFGLNAGAWGNAIDYWIKTNATVLTKFNRISGHHANNGDIVVLFGLSGNPYGHIGVATGAGNGSSIEILEQNGSTGNGSGVGPDAIRKRYVSRSRVAGLLRPKHTSNMPSFGARVKLIQGITRTTFKAGTTTKAGVIHATDNSYIYTVRGYDPKFAGRILINSASGGGDGVALALYYTNGHKIDGWRLA